MLFRSNITKRVPLRILGRLNSLENLSSNNPLLSSFLSELNDCDVSKRLEIGKWCAGGGHAGVYDGELKPGKQDNDGWNRESTKVAVKRFRAFMSMDSNSAGVCRQRLVTNSTHDDV